MKYCLHILHDGNCKQCASAHFVWHQMVSHLHITILNFIFCIILSASFLSHILHVGLSILLISFLLETISTRFDASDEYLSIIRRGGETIDFFNHNQDSTVFASIAEQNSLVFTQSYIQFTSSLYLDGTCSSNFLPCLYIS